MGGDETTRKPGERAVFETVDFLGGRLRLIDQTLLPGERRTIEPGELGETAEAIRSLRVRGAPAIGIAAAYGVLLELELALEAGGLEKPLDRLKRRLVCPPAGLDGAAVAGRLRRACDELAATRPTAVNLFAALDRMRQAVDAADEDPSRLCAAVPAEAFAIHEEELETEFAIGCHGASFVREGARVLTHCNAGGLATAGWGTALALLYEAWRAGRRFEVWADETRPLLQGARITAWELTRRGIPVTVLCEGAAASLFAAERVDLVVTGADRIAANGDVANKVGTLGLAVLCARFGVPFVVAAPRSTFDPAMGSGAGIPIEERPETEVACVGGQRTVPAEAGIYNPAFDVTPAELVSAIVTELGVIERPDRVRVAAHLAGRNANTRPGEDASPDGCV